MDYDSDAVPTESIPDLPEATQAFALQEMIAMLSEAPDELNFNTCAGFVYDRKGYASLDPLAGQRNFRGRRDDDVVLQVTVRVTSRTAEALIARAVTDQAAANEVLRAKTIARKEQERNLLDAQILELQAQRERL